MIKCSIVINSKGIEKPLDIVTKVSETLDQKKFNIDIKINVKVD